MAEAIPTLEPAARQLWPGTFAGLWLGKGGYGDTISIAFTEGAEEKVSELGKGFPRPELLRAVTFERSMAELEGRQERMISDRELARAGTLSVPGVPGAAYDLGIDQPQNAIYVVVEDATPEAIAAFTTLYGADVIVREGPLVAPLQEATDIADGVVPDAASCSRQDCRYKLRSGLSVYSQSGTCSSGFTVKRSDGTRFLLSAAHCPGSRRLHGGERYGEVRDQQQQGRVDAERHSVEGLFGAKPWIFVDNQEKRRPVRSTSTWEGLPAGARVCKSGQTTGRSCGDVFDKHFSPSYVPNGNRFVATEACAEPGDSGSGVYGADNEHPRRAHGILSGSPTLSCLDPADTSIFGHIEYAQDALNVRVVIAP